MGGHVRRGYWSRHRLNELADAGDFEAITRKVNGGSMATKNAWRSMTSR